MSLLGQLALSTSVLLMQSFHPQCLRERLHQAKNLSSLFRAAKLTLVLPVANLKNTSDISSGFLRNSTRVACVNFRLDIRV
ncbi:hypothetical protein EMIT0P258_240017 [Pseudomonas sp. IT-P258]